MLSKMAMLLILVFGYDQAVMQPVQVSDKCAQGEIQVYRQGQVLLGNELKRSGTDEHIRCRAMLDRLAQQDVAK